MLVAPLWLIYRVLASRFGIGLTGESDSKLGSPVDVLEYVWHTIGDFGAGWAAATAVIAALAVLGGVVLFRTRPAAVLLAATVLLVPTLALMVARSQSSVFLESRHLIFALPFFQMLVAAGLLRLAGPLVLAGAIALIAAAILARSRVKLIGGAFGAAIALLFGGQALAVVTGLASGATEPTGWRWALVLGALAGYTLCVAAMGVGGCLLLGDLFRQRRSPAVRR